MAKNQQNDEKLADMKAQLQAVSSTETVTAPNKPLENPEPAQVEQAKQLEKDLKPALESDKPATRENAERLMRERVPQDLSEGDYRLKPGRTHYAEGKMFKGGDTVKLSARQAYTFRDKFEKA